MHRTLLITSVLTILTFGTVFSQKPPNQAVGVNIGFATHDGHKTLGAGIIFSVGYKKLIWKDRLRINYTFLYGKFTHSMATDNPEQNFVSRTFNTSLSYDIIHFGVISFTVALGAFVDNAYGTIGSGAFGDNKSQCTTIAKVNDWTTGVYVGGSIRINLTNSFALELGPLSFSGGPELAKINTSIGLVFGL